MSWEYKQKSEDQLKTWFQDKVRNRKSGFSDFSDFLNWYNDNVKDNKCHYCNLSEWESQKLIHLGLLKSKRFPFNGLFSQGVNRGYWLEIDRKDPNGIYSRENCVPTCYFCNNDKSDVFTDTEYQDFVKDRIGFLKRILKKYD